MWVLCFNGGLDEDGGGCFVIVCKNRVEGKRCSHLSTSYQNLITSGPSSQFDLTGKSCFRVVLR